MTDAESSVDKVDTYMHPYSISLGQKVSKRTKVIANSRPEHRVYVWIYLRPNGIETIL